MSGVKCPGVKCLGVKCLAAIKCNVHYLSTAETLLKVKAREVMGSSTLHEQLVTVENWFY